ncbi:MAG TPA: TspO/MBR family protein [Gaiellaceae bacterium]|nr:TspO/MBR family protein [Gaiellaceae bacterium]
MKRSALRVVVAFGGSAAAAIVGDLGSRRAPEIYDELDKPSWAPPAGAFAPVWSLLYATMAVAAWRLSRTGARTPLMLHGAQLVLNAAWPSAFFARRSRRASLTIIVALDVAVAAEIASARRHDRVASALLAPYLAWTLYATALNYAVGRSD